MKTSFDERQTGDAQIPIFETQTHEREATPESLPIEAEVSDYPDRTPVFGFPYRRQWVE